MSTVVVLGSGYVGRALGRRLRTAGHRVVGVCRSAEGVAAVEDAGLDGVRGDVTDPSALAALPDAAVIVFAASAGGRGAAAARSVYVEGLETAVEAYAARERPPDRLVYTSSTGVYGDHRGAWVDESTELRPETDRERVLVEAERAAFAARESGIDPAVARLGGLYGPGRYRLDRYLEGPVTEGYLNQVHRADAAGALAHLATADASTVPDTVLVVDDEPVWKPDLAAWLADQLGREPPKTRPPDTGSSRRSRAQKRCSNERLRSLGYGFEYPTFREGYAAAIEDYRP